MPPKKQKADDSFFQKVYKVARKIPRGRVTSYGAIANYLGSKMSSRMVGWAMNGAPRGVPAHRVVNRIGLLTGKHHFKTPYTMQRLLQKEGIKVVNDKIIRFADFFWDPAKELAVK